MEIVEQKWKEKKFKKQIKVIFKIKNMLLVLTIQKEN